MALKFKIIKKCWQNASNHLETDVDFLLEESDWNDYGYYTMHFLHASAKLTGGNPICLGAMRIMRKNQSANVMYILKGIFNNESFTGLPEEFVSLSMDVDLYMGLNKWLTTENDRKEIISDLRIILGKESEFFDESLLSDECFRKSLLRDGSDLENFALKKGKMLLTGSECIYDLRKESISVKFSHVSNEIELNFNCVNEDSEYIPNGLLVFIGKNGSGKSTAIYKLAKLMYTDSTQRFRMKEKVGELKPNNVGVSKLFLISYSPFDNFVLPTSYDKDYIKLIRKGEDVNSRFIFCGIRNIEDEPIDLVINENTNNELLEKSLEDRRSKTSLKDISVLAEEFVTAISQIINGQDGRCKILDEFINRCSIKQPSLYDDIKSINVSATKEELKNLFLSLSTGHKFFLHSYARLLAYIDENSLVLFDEPENHLHPPLLSFLMSSFRLLLNKYKSVMYVATHSPVILQETFAKNVLIVRKFEGVSTISHPSIETYGANIAAITSEVFDLTTSITEYHDAIKFLYHKWLNNYRIDSVEEMLKYFERRLGHNLSDQLETYLINLYASEHDVEN